VFGSNIPDPVQSCVLAEIGGAESVVCYFRDDLKTVNERDLRILREVVKTHFNVRCDINEHSVKSLLKLKPDMVTFVSSKDDSSLQPAPINISDYLSPLSDYIADLRANNIANSILIDPDIDSVKIAGKLEFDYVEFDVFKYCRSENLDEELAELENINSLSAASNKYGMGVNVSGPLSASHLGDISKIQYLEDIIISQAIIDKALAVGFDNAIRDFIGLL
jgi:pyridoxine 5-phosphate synthase